ncbi:MAG TPA: adenylyl-sulfate kinase [Firmicutes bacterium]|jgi:adenylyl-sulfate kinase|nr:adenylyl-sulfate kinase [Bacillota bacterium]
MRRPAGFTLWFTGLSGSGKTTVGSLVKQELERRRIPVEMLDGDEFRTHLSKGLGFSREDRDTNIRRIGYVAKLLTKHGVAVITTAISPYRDTRAEVRIGIGRFVEVYVRCPLAVCVERDVKGLYKKALRGEISHFTGVDDPYEEPLSPDLILETATEEPEQSAARVIALLESLHYLPQPVPTANGILSAQVEQP